MTAVQTTDTEFANSKVDDHAKQGFWKVVFVMVGFTFFSPSMLAGGTLGLGLGGTEFFLAIALGNLFLAIYTGLLAHIAQKTALGLDLLAQHVFGKTGSYLPSALISITQMGWFGVGVAMFALPVADMLPQNLLGFSNVILLVIVIGAAMTFTAAMGVKALAFFGGLAVPLIAILGTYSNWLSVEKVGSFSQVFSTPSTRLSMVAAVSIVIANFVSGGTATPNFARFARTNRTAVSATVLAFFVGNCIMFIFGAVGAAAYGKADIFDVLILQGLAVPAILTLGLNIWSTNNNALYTTGLGFSHITGLGVRLTTIIAGTIGTVFAVVLYDNFIGYLSLLGGMIPPVGAVLVMHYFLHKSQYSLSHEQILGINWPALLAVVAGITGGLTMNFGIVPLNSLLTAALSYLLLDFIFARAGWKMNIASSVEAAH
ncbi:cytosine permease [Actinomycetaceae bacterium TAE3-ERU4]|nr:cytosine permease [Actinomycetaceae bacterium TAE3-ERU4]